MKNVNKILGLSFLIYLFTTSFSFGQPQRPPRPPHEMTEEEMMKHIEKEQVILQLSDEQKEAHKEIALKYGEQFKELFGDREEREKKRVAMAKLKASKDAEMKELLTKKQYEAYALMQEERMNKMKQARGKRN